VFIVTAYPFLYVLFLAVMPYDQYLANSVHLLPSGFTLDYLLTLARTPGLAEAYGVSIVRTIAGTVLGVSVTLATAYALSHPRFRFARPLRLLFLIPLFFFPGIVPFWMVIRSVGLLHSPLALVLPFVVSPLWFFIARAYFVGFPSEILDSASVDGAGHFRTFLQIVVPISKPLVATLAMLYATFFWSEFFWARVLVRQDLWPATVYLQNAISGREVLQGLGAGVRLADVSLIAAMAALLIVPVLVVYPFLQRYVLSGLAVGAVKE
jgi:putative aldouronate transport system permease protein